MVFRPGPVFTNLLLADEINRASPKTQSAMLETMQEQSVTLLGTTRPLPQPFFVLASQNPIELEGTYVLPEAQLDRFMFCARIAYPTRAEEVQIVRGTTTNAVPEVHPVMSSEELLRLQRILRGVPVADDVVDYAVRLVAATRPQADVPGPETVARYVTYGASPRASQYLILGAKARALLAHRYHVNFEDVRSVTLPVLRHRVVLNFRSRADRVEPDAIIADILKAVPEEA